MHVDPSGYAGAYGVRYAGTALATGPSDFVLVGGFQAHYNLVLNGIGDFDFGVDATGNVSTTSDAAQAVGNTLILNAKTIHVDPSGYAGAYGIRYAGTALATGPSDFVLVGGLQADYNLVLNGIDDFDFAVDAAGSVSTTSDAAHGVGDTLAFNAGTIQVDPDGFAGTYSIRNAGVPIAAGLRDVVLVGGLQANYELIVTGVDSFQFAVDAAGLPDPSSIPVTVAPDTYTFLLSAVPTIVVNAADDVDDGVVDAAHTSLREAINLANSTVGVEERIIFGIPGAGAHTIGLTSALPTVTDPVTIDGTTQPGYAGSPIVEVDGAAVAGTVLTITASDSSVQALAVKNASGVAVRLSGGSGNDLSNLDLSWTGTGTSGRGIELIHSSENTVVDVTATNRRIGIYLAGTSGDNTIEGNHLSGASYAAISASLNSGQGNGYFGNDLSNSGSGYFALAISSDPLLEVSGNDFSNSTNGIQLLNMEYIDVSPDAGPGQVAIDVSTVTGTGLSLREVHHSSIHGLDLSWAGADTSGKGIELLYSSDNLIENVTATNRRTGMYLAGGAGDNTIQGNDFSWSGFDAISAAQNTGGHGNRYLGNDLSHAAHEGPVGYYALNIAHDTQFEIASNDLSESANGLQLAFMDDIDVSPDPTLPEQRKVVIDVSSVRGAGLRLRDVTNSRVQDLDLSWSGADASGKGIELVYSSGNVIENVTATNRRTGMYLAGGPVTTRSRETTFHGLALTPSQLLRTQEGTVTGIWATTCPMQPMKAQ